jgi:single-strand DNA-binding protein
MIKLQAIGHLGKDATMNQVNGKNVINFSVAHSESYKDAKGEKHDKTIWIECAHWTDKTGVLPYLKKGTQVFVEGSPEVRTYSKADGSMGVSLSLRVGMIQLLGSSNGKEDAVSNETQKEEKPAEKAKVLTKEEAASANAAVDELPF